MRERLPIDDYIPEIVAHVRERRAVVVTAAPGAGKTTRVPPALIDDGPVLLLQPRRVAARSIARRIAEERGWSVGREVGWHVRFDRHDSKETRLLVATEGMLTARLQQDPLLSDFRTVIIDEFHERSIHADIGIALARQAWQARPDLRLAVMSATMDSGRVSAYLDHCPIVEVPGRLHPVQIGYRPGVTPEDAVMEAWPNAGGAILCFLPGAHEIRRVAERLAGRLGTGRIHQLHGGLEADVQDAALAPSADPRVILSTNIAETTLTVPDVRVVVDAGWQKVARYDAERGLDRLEAERISQDAADQRAGRAGRVAAGRVIRLWDARDRLRTHREPDVVRVDLAGPVMDIIAWGGNPGRLEWFERPPAAALDEALRLLTALGAIDAEGRLTAIGHDLRPLPLHPRLGRLLLEAGAAPTAARACALLSERRPIAPNPAATSCDLLAACARERDLPPHVLRVARDLSDIGTRLLGGRARSRIDDESFRRAVLSAYPDRVARRRAVGSDRFLLASGTGARLGRESAVVSHEFIVAVEVTAGVARPVGESVAAGSRRPRPATLEVRPQATEAVIRLATGIERDWIRPTSREIEHRLDAESGRVRASATERVGAVVIRERDVPADPAVAAKLLAAAIVERGPSPDDATLLRRLAAAGLNTSFESLAESACEGIERLSQVDLAAHVPPSVRRTLDRDAPAELLLPSGRKTRLDYQPDGRIVASVKLQELFGLAETPRIGPAKTPVAFELLAPNGRPVQVTTDLRSFWNGGYQEVRRELRARYPRHPWPDDPWTATPTHRTSRRR